MSFVSIGLRTKKTEDNPHGYVNVGNIPNDEVCVLYLGGDGTKDDKAANGYAKIIENEILDTIETDVPVYSVAYNFAENKQSISRRLEFIKHRTEVLSSDDSLNKTIKQASEEEYNPQYIDKLFEKAISVFSTTDQKNKLPKVKSQNGSSKYLKYSSIFSRSSKIIGLKSSIKILILKLVKST